MNTPGSAARLQDSIETALADLGQDDTVADSSAVPGGCVNHGTRLLMSSGTEYFLKWHMSAPPGMFEAEEAGLRALAEVCPLRTPRPVARGGGHGAPAWFLMEYIAPGRPAAGYDAALGRGLAALHGSGLQDAFGWHRDNWLGTLTQDNTPSTSWVGFWRDRRLLPQLTMARNSGYLTGAKGRICDRALALVPVALAEVDDCSPSLLHGDLWSGNVYADETGAPVLIDPAPYCGHGEVDLAMMALFGGSGSAFHAAYNDLLEISGAFAAFRKDLYQLYYLLAHVNLFGSSYVSGVQRAAERVVVALE